MEMAGIAFLPYHSFPWIDLLVGLIPLITIFENSCLVCIHIILSSAELPQKRHFLVTFQQGRVCRVSEQPECCEGSKKYYRKE